MRATKRDLEALEAIYNHYLEHNRAPSVEEMATYLGINHASVKSRINRLVLLELIEVEPSAIALKTEAINYLTEDIT